MGVVTVVVGVSVKVSVTRVVTAPHVGAVVTGVVTGGSVTSTGVVGDCCCNWKYNWSEELADMDTKA